MATIRGCALLLAGAALLTAACGRNGPSEAMSIMGDTGNGTLRVIAVDAAGKPVDSATVEIERALDCDAAAGFIAPGTSFTNHFSDVTDDSGAVSFTQLPLGCYRINASTDDTTVESAAFLTASGPAQSETVKLVTTEGGSPVKCDPQRIADDLDLPGDQRRAPATVAECDDNWSVIRWDVPGDSQRVVRSFEGRWLTYVAFPTDRCWKQAKHDGAPATFEKYFQPC